MQSFQILSQCYHPNFTQSNGKDPAPGDYLLILEQQYRPSYSSTVQAKKGRKDTVTKSVMLTEYQNYAIQNDFGVIEEDLEEEEKGSQRSKVSRIKRNASQISCNHRTLAQYYRQQIGISLSNQNEWGDKNSDSASQVSLKDSRARSVSPAPEPASSQAAQRNAPRKGIKTTVKQQSQVFQGIGKSKNLN